MDLYYEIFNVVPPPIGELRTGANNGGYNRVQSENTPMFVKDTLDRDGCIVKGGYKACDILSVSVPLFGYQEFSPIFLTCKLIGLSKDIRVPSCPEPLPQFFGLHFESYKCRTIPFCT